MTPLSNPKFFLGKPTNQAVFYAETLRRIFEKLSHGGAMRDRYVIDVGELYVPEMKKMICLHADLLCIDYEGSVLDACCIALLAALMIFPLTGCEKSLLDKDDPVTLTFWHVYGEQSGSPMDELVDEFNRTVGAEKGVRVTVTATSSASQIGSFLLQAQAGGSELPEMPDLGAEGQMRLNEDGQIVDPAQGRAVTGSDPVEGDAITEDEASQT